MASRSAVAPLLAPLRAAATATAAALTCAASEQNDHANSAAALVSAPPGVDSTTSTPPTPDKAGGPRPAPSSCSIQRLAADAANAYQAATAAAPLAQASLSLLHRLVSHAGCVTALASTPAASHAATQLLFAPPSAEVLLAGIRLIRALAGGCRVVVIKS